MINSIIKSSTKMTIVIHMYNTQYGNIWIIYYEYKKKHLHKSRIINTP